MYLPMMKTLITVCPLVEWERVPCTNQRYVYAIMTLDFIDKHRVNMANALLDLSREH